MSDGHVAIDPRAAQMVAEQLQHRVLDDRVLQAMREVPRHLFVPADMERQAYDDSALEIGHGQTISQPLMVGLLLEALQLKGDERVLDIGTGSGYQAALLSRLAGEVYSVEIIPALADSARTALASAGCKSVVQGVCDGSIGWPEHAPYDAIVVAAAAPECPKELVDQLAMGGRIIVPIGPDHVQTLQRITRTRWGLSVEELTPCRFVPLVGRRGTQSLSLN